MNIAQRIRSRRVLAGGIALAAGTATIAAPAVAPPLAANPLNDADVSPSVNGDSGTYQSCSAMFGLTDKTNANYVTFSVSGTASPLPGIGAGLTPVLTIANGGTVERCTLVVGFDNQTSWASYLNLPADPEVFAVLPYGGSPGYLVPNFAPVPTGVPGGATAAAPTFTVSIEQSDPSLTVTASPTSLLYPPVPTPGEALTLIADELGGASSPLGARFNELMGGAVCDDNLPIDIELGAAFTALTGIPAVVFDEIAPTPCAKILYGYQIRIPQLQVEALGLPVAVTVTAPAPGPRPNPTPGPEPVAPKHTG